MNIDQIKKLAAKKGDIAVGVRASEEYGPSWEEIVLLPSRTPVPGTDYCDIGSVIRSRADALARECGLATEWEMERFAAAIGW